MQPGRPEAHTYNDHANQNVRETFANIGVKTAKTANKMRRTDKRHPTSKGHSRIEILSETRERLMFTATGACRFQQYLQQLLYKECTCKFVHSPGTALCLNCVMAIIVIIIVIIIIIIIIIIILQ